MDAAVAFDQRPGERIHHTGALRPEGAIVVTNRRLVVNTEAETVSIPYENVREINTESFDWMLAILSGAMALFGIYSLRMYHILGLVFILTGAWSIRRTYHHRNRLRIHTHSQAKPVEVFPVNVENLYVEVQPAISRFRRHSEDQAALYVNS